MGTKIEYVQFPGGVKVAKHPDARGYHRCRWTDRDGNPADRRFSDWDEAEAFAFELSVAVRSDRAGTPRLADRPISELVEAWHDPASHDRPLTPTYMRSAACWHRKYVVPTIGKVMTGAWNVDHTRQVLAAGRDNGLADSSLNRLRRDMCSLVAVGKRLGYLGLQQDPVTTIRALPGSNDPDLTNLPERSDILHLSEAMVQVTGLWWRGLQVNVLALTGLRIGELLGLTYDDVDIERRKLRVARQLTTIAGPFTMGLPKYESQRVVPISQAVADRLGELMAEHADLAPVSYLGRGKVPDGEGVPLFPGARGGFERYSTFKNQRWGPACYAAGWKRDPSGRGFEWTPHTLRHFFCTMALAPKPDGLGLEVADVSRLAGHKTPDMTWRVYVQSRPGRIERGADALDALAWDV